MSSSPAAERDEEARVLGASYCPCLIPESFCRRKRLMSKERAKLIHLQTSMENTPTMFTFSVIL